MPQKNALNGNAAVKTEDDTQMRVTSARSFYRTVLSTNKSQKMSVVRADNADDLHAKEHDCCSRATD
jgi:hypothetical protein